jgi:hypothetical protein
MNEPAGAELVKVQMADRDGYKETPWASRVESGVDQFRLENSPFYAYGVSFEDVVEARPLGVRRFDGVPMYEFVRVIRRSGNRTLRFAFSEEKSDTPTGRQVLDEIVALGCSYEGMFNITISVTVPPDVDLQKVAMYLTSTGLRWEYVDPTYEQVHGGPSVLARLTSAVGRWRLYDRADAE